MKLIKNARVIAGQNGDKLVKKDILFDEKKIISIGDDINDYGDETEVIDANGLVALPGLIDVHVHLREPGNEHKETIKTGTMAAAAGGFTTIMAMPNVKPFPDDMETMKNYQALIDRESFVNTVPYACISEQEKGSCVVDMEDFCKNGYMAFSDDGVGVQRDEVMEDAMKLSAKFGVKIVAHTEDMHYRRPGACINEGKKSEELGVLGIPNECEFKQLERDLKLVEKTGAHYHCCHMSCKQSVELLKEYKEKGCDVTGEVAVHHLLLTDADVKGPNWKMNPPLRSEADRVALVEAIKTGDVDMIANDHAPHGEDEKAKGLVEAPFGIVAIETAFCLLYTKLVKTGEITFGRLIELMSKVPAERFGFENRGQLENGYASDIILVDIDNEFAIDKNKFLSKGKNTPFDGWKCYGKVKQTFVNGKQIYKED